MASFRLRLGHPSYTPLCTPAQFAESMTAALADLSKLARPSSTFAAFHGHFLSTFPAFRPGISAINSPSIDSQQYIVRMAGRDSRPVPSYR
jgi:hypothetical protein